MPIYILTILAVFLWYLIVWKRSLSNVLNIYIVYLHPILLPFQVQVGGLDVPAPYSWAKPNDWPIDGGRSDVRRFELQHLIANECPSSPLYFLPL